MVNLSGRLISSCISGRGSDACLARPLRRRFWTTGRSLVRRVPVPVFPSEISLDAFGPRAMLQDHRTVLYLDASSALAILLVALVARILFDVSVASLLVEILAARDLIFCLHIGIAARSFGTALLGRNRWHFVHCVPH